MYLEVLVVKVCDNHQVCNTSAHIAVGIDPDGIKHMLGIWVHTLEGATFWTRGAGRAGSPGASNDTLIVCGEGLTGLP